MAGSDIKFLGTIAAALNQNVIDRSVTLRGSHALAQVRRSDLVFGFTLNHRR
jgi:hypothetical protein